jgi:hypothetical protein
MRGDVSITICDDCLDDYYNDSKINRRRECIYYSSAVFTVGFLISLFFWCYVIILEMDKIDKKEE